VAIESRFSPRDKGELKCRTSPSAAQFIWQSPDERERVLKSISKMYDRRSAQVHGSYDVNEYDACGFATATEADECQPISRLIRAVEALRSQEKHPVQRVPLHGPEARRRGCAAQLFFGRAVGYARGRGRRFLPMSGANSVAAEVLADPAL